jgi:hypothetical protein
MQRVLRPLSVAWIVASAWASGMTAYVALAAAQGGLSNGVEWRDLEVMAAWTGFAWAASFFPVYLPLLLWIRSRRLVGKRTGVLVGLAAVVGVIPSAALIWSVNGSFRYILSDGGMMLDGFFAISGFVLAASFRRWLVIPKG